MQQKTARLEMRFDPVALKRVDDWRAIQPDLPSRSLAIRRLIDLGLFKNEPKFEPSIEEKLIITMLCGLYRHLQVDVDKEGIDPDFINKATVGGHPWALAWEYSHMFEKDVDAKIAEEVAAMLEMWWIIELSYARLSNEDRANLEVDVGITKEGIAFRGFDLNNEFEHYGAAKFMIGGMSSIGDTRFERFEGRDINSHNPTLHEYRRMLVLYEGMPREQKWKDLTPVQIVAIVNGA